MGFTDEIVKQIFWLLAFGFKLTIQALLFLFGFARGVWANRTPRYNPGRLGRGSSEGGVLENLECYVLQLPRRLTWDSENARRLMTVLCGYGEIALQISATQEGIRWQVLLWQPVYPGELEQAIRAYYPEIVVERQPYPLQDSQRYRAVQAWKQGAIFPAPITTVDQIKAFDPLAPFTQALSDLQAGERIVWSLVLTGEAPGANQNGYRLITQSTTSAFQYITFDSAAYAEVIRLRGYDQQRRYEYNLDKVMREKINNPLYHALGLLQVEAANPRRVEELLTRCSAHLYNFANPPFNSLVAHGIVAHGAADIMTETLGLVHLYLPGMDNSWREHLLILSIDELAALWHLPHEGLSAEGIGWSQRIEAPLSKALQAISDGVVLGVNRYGGQEHSVRLAQRFRDMHVAIVGRTGMGKSSLLHHMIHQDIHAGRGVCLIDPKGDLVRDVLSHSIPSGRENDVIVLDVAAKVDGVWYPPPLNPLNFAGELSNHVLAGRVTDIFAQVFDDFADKKMAETLKMVLQALTVLDNPTLLDAYRFATDIVFRGRIVEQLRNPLLVTHWRNFMSAKENQQNATLEPIQWRLRDFIGNELLQAMTCHSDPLPLSQWIAANKILLVSLKAGNNQIPERERYLLGAGLVAQIDMAVREEIITQPPFILYIDEAQEFTRTALPEMLSQLRSFGLGLVLSNQYFRQMVGETFDALEGNISTLVSFEIGDKDKGALDPYMKPSFQDRDLLHLGQYRAAVSMRAGSGSREPAFSLETLPPPGEGQPNRERELVLRRKSVANYTPRSYDEVSQKLMEQYAGERDLPAAKASEDGFFEE